MPTAHQRVRVAFPERLLLALAELHWVADKASGDERADQSVPVLLEHALDAECERLKAEGGSGAELA